MRGTFKYLLANLTLSAFSWVGLVAQGKTVFICPTRNCSGSDWIIGLKRDLVFLRKVD